jgi:prephenate dehydrogenase
MKKGTADNLPASYKAELRQVAQDVGDDLVKYIGTHPMLPPRHRHSGQRGMAVDVDGSAKG